MDVSASRRRIPAVFVWGALAVLAWAAFTALVGGGDARADDDTDKPLSGVSSLLTGVVSEVADPLVEGVVEVVTETTAPVVNATEKVVEKTVEVVAKVPVVGKPASDALGTTGQAVSTVVETVGDVAADSPVSSVVKPVTDIVREVPVVGTVLDDLGATDLLDDSAGAVDGVVDSLTPVVDRTVPPVIEALDPQHPNDDATTAPDGATPTPAAPGPDASATDPQAMVRAAADPAPVAVAFAMKPTFVASVGVVASSATQTRSDADEPTSPATGPPLAMAPASSSAGPGGSAGGMNAALHHLHVHADGAWAAAGHPADSALPPSPVGSTDVSPD